MRIGVIIIGVVLLLMGAGPTVVGITTVGITGGHILPQNNTNITAGFTNAVSLFGYAEIVIGVVFMLLGAYLLVVGMHSPDRRASSGNRRRKR